jgi:hypothetical protein
MGLRAMKEVGLTTEGVAEYSATHISSNGSVSITTTSIYCIKRWLDHGSVFTDSNAVSRSFRRVAKSRPL